MFYGYRSDAGIYCGECVVDFRDHAFADHTLGAQALVDIRRDERYHGVGAFDVFHHAWLFEAIDQLDR